MHEQSTHRIRIDLAYDGTNYHGWATQPGLPTVQEAVEQGLHKILRENIAVTVAGRTDAGVHAARQVLHCDVPRHRWSKLSGNTPDREPAAALVSKLNGVLAREAGAIRILEANIAPQGFDARFSALSRSYRYRIYHGTVDPLTRYFTYHHRRQLSAELMTAELAGLTGLHDFGSFCKPRPGATTIRTLERFELEHGEQTISVLLRADAFCHHMVRALVGALLQVGDGTRPPGWLRDRLATPVRDSHMSIAPAHGLILEHVAYPADELLAQRANQTRMKRDPTRLSCD